MLLSHKSDVLGMAISSLCFVHCFATPFIFVAQTCALTCCAETPTWWKAIDYIFLGISFFAILFSTKIGSKNWVKILLWISWLLLSIAIFFEEAVTELTFQNVIFVPAILLVLFHFYNKRFCGKAKKNSSCATTCCNKVI